MGWRDVDQSERTEVASWIGPRLHPFGQDIGSVVPTGFDAYARLPTLRRDVILPLLAKNTSTPERCWICLWEGYGYFHAGGIAVLRAYRIGRPLEPPPPPPPPPKLSKHRVRLPARDYILFTGSVEQAAGWQDGPNLWWPDDRAWCVASEIDLTETFVGGSQALIDDVLEQEGLGATATTPDDSHLPTWLR